MERLAAALRRSDRNAQFCDGMPTETALLDAMKSAASWRIEGSKLELLDAKQRSLATFEARNL